MYNFSTQTKLVQNAAEREEPAREEEVDFIKNAEHTVQLRDGILCCHSGDVLTLFTFTRYFVILRASYLLRKIALRSKDTFGLRGLKAKAQIASFSSVFYFLALLACFGLRSLICRQLVPVPPEHLASINTHT